MRKIMHYSPCSTTNRILFWIILILISVSVRWTKCVTLTRNKRVVNGELTEPGQWPFLISLKNKQMRQLWEKNEPTYMDWSTVGDDSHICGAALISTYWAVTANHCLKSLNTTLLTGWTAAIGSYNLVMPSKHEQFITIDTIITPDNPKDNEDFAFLHLKTPVKLTNFSRPVCIIQEDIKVKDPECYGMGWGTNISITKTTVFPIAKYFKGIYQKDSCGNPSDLICFAPGNGIACRGDSGGPMVCRNSAKDRWQLIGVASTATGCINDSHRVFYTKIAKFLHYLNDSVRKEVICSSASLPYYNLWWNLLLLHLILGILFIWK